jgi:hypothetical protein
MLPNAIKYNIFKNNKYWAQQVKSSNHLRKKWLNNNDNVILRNKQ